MSFQSRNWCFTDFKLNDWKSLDMEKIRYICVGEETCPDTKRVHLQGWIQFYNKRTLGGVQRLTFKGPHFESCKGSEYDNEKYCTKDGKYWSKGNFITQGNRTDLTKFKEILEDGGSLADLMDKDLNLYCRYRNGLRDYAAVCAKRQRRKYRGSLKVKVLSGPTGVGKTSRIINDPEVFPINGDQLKWFDGYEGEKKLLIDEYDNNVSAVQLIKLLDGNTQRLDCKGTFTYAAWDTVYITTNLRKEQFHRHAKKAHRDAIFRRVTQWIDLWPNGQGTQGNTEA